MLRKTFFRGMTVVLPIAITFALLIWIFRTIEDIFGMFIQKLFGSEHYFTGLGVLVGLAFVFLVGVTMNAWLGRRLHSWGEQLLQRIPLVKTLYSSIRDLMAFFGASSQTAHSRVVTVNLLGGRVLGLLTREQFNDTPKGIGTTGEEVAVFIPMSYQIGGFTIVVPKSAVSSIDMDVESAMRYAVTAGMSARAPRKKQEN